MNYVDLETSYEEARPIETKDGVYYTSITSVVAHNGFARITLGKTIPRNLTPTDVKSIQFLLRCRIASDEIEFEYLTSNTAQLNLTFKQIRETPRIMLI